MSYLPPFSVVSTLNSTSTPLGSGTNYAGTPEPVTNYAAISVIITSDVASVADGVQFVWSPTGAGSFTTTPKYTYRLTDDYGNPLGGQLFTSEIYGAHFNISFTKLALDVQSSFNLQTLFHFHALQLPVEKASARYNSQANALPVKTLPVGAFLINRSGTIATGGVAQDVMVARPTRKYASFQNVSDTEMWLDDTGNSAVPGEPSYRVFPGGFYQTDPIAATEAISVYCALAGKEYAAREV